VYTINSWHEIIGGRKDSRKMLLFDEPLLPGVTPINGMGDTGVRALFVSL
jgi:hypothetical protein